MSAKLLGWMVLHARSASTNEIEILVLRHQLAVLQRCTPPPRISWTDRAVIAALTRLLPVRRRRGFLITPATILRWHRNLVHRRWTTPPVRAGRPAIATGLRALTVRAVDGRWIGLVDYRIYDQQGRAVVFHERTAVPAEALTPIPQTPRR